MTAVARGSRPKESTVSAAHMLETWRHRCTALEEQLQDARADYSALQAEHGELKLDYRHALQKLWDANRRR